MAKEQSPVQNPELITRMEAFMEEHTAENEMRMIDAIYKARFLAPVEFADDEVGAVPQQEQNIAFSLITAEGGDKYFPAFTDLEELAKWRNERTRTLEFGYQDYKQLLRQTGEVSGFVINPYSQKVRVSREAIRRMEEKLSLVRVPKGTKMRIGQPEKYPDQMVAELRVFLRQRPQVSRAYLVLAQREGYHPCLMIIVDSEGEKSALFSEIGEVARRHLAEGQSLEMSGVDADFARQAIEKQNLEPFYEKL